MERIKTLINKLVEIELNQDSNKHLLQIAEMLVVELRQMPSPIEGKVTLQMPYVFLERKEEEKTATTFFELPKETKIEFSKVIENISLNTEQPQKIVFELNEIMVADEESLNEKLNEQKTEVANTIKDGPVKDLRKAIGVNDKYLFINELFNGDETMYEKCIKTINGFSVYPEAEIWIKRELLIKMSWVEPNEAVQLFYQLVRRRFM